MTVFPIPVDPNVGKWLNLLRASPSFVLLEGPQPGDERLEEMRVVPTNSGVCWISGQVTTPQQRTFEAVHIVNTDDGGQLTRSYVWDGEWYPVDQLAVIVGEEGGRTHPFHYSFAVVLQEDRYSDARGA